jgi:hypothetical protein
MRIRVAPLILALQLSILTSVRPTPAGEQEGPEAAPPPAAEAPDQPTTPPGATSADGSIHFIFGSKVFPSDEWEPGDHQDERGIVLAFGPHAWPVRLVLGYLSSEATPDITVIRGSGQSFSSEQDPGLARSRETSFGVRKGRARGVVRPYLEGGVAAVWASRDYNHGLCFSAGSCETFKDTGFGVWFGGGVALRYRAFEIGAMTRLTAADSSMLTGLGGIHYGLFVGFGWPDTVPPPGAPPEPEGQEGTGAAPPHVAAAPNRPPATPGATSTEGSFHVIYGSNVFQSDEWEPGDQQDERGLVLAVAPRAWPVRLVLGYLSSEDHPDITVVSGSGISTTVEQTTGLAQSREITIGVRKARSRGVVRPYGEGGLAGIKASRDYNNGYCFSSGSCETFEDTALGAWFGAGVALRFRAFEIGAMARVTGAPSSIPGGLSGAHYGLFIGFGWPSNVPPPETPPEPPGED